MCEDGIQALHYFFLVSVSIVMSDQGPAALPTLGARIIRGNRRRRTEIARIRALGRVPRQARGLLIRTEQRKNSENEKHKFGLWMGDAMRERERERRKDYNRYTQARSTIGRPDSHSPFQLRVSLTCFCRSFFLQAWRWLGVRLLREKREKRVTGSESGFLPAATVRRFA